MGRTLAPENLAAAPAIFVPGEASTGDAAPARAMRDNAGRLLTRREIRRPPCRQTRAARWREEFRPEGMSVACLPLFFFARGAMIPASFFLPPVFDVLLRTWPRASSSSNLRRPATAVADPAVDSKHVHVLSGPGRWKIVQALAAAEVAEKASSCQGEIGVGGGEGSWLPGTAGHEVVLTTTFSDPEGFCREESTAVECETGLGRLKEEKIGMWKAASGDHGRTCSRIASAAWL